MAVSDDGAMSQIASLRTVPRQARGKHKLTLMIHAADAIMASEGADAITTTRVAREAGISVGSVYRYLPHRGAIIEALAHHYLALLEDRMESLVAAVESGSWEQVDPVGAAVDVFAGFYRANPGFRALWFGRHLTAETRDLDRAHKLTMATRLRTVLVAQGVGREDTATLRVGQVIQLSTDAVMQEAFRADPNGDEDLLDQLKTMVRAYLAELTPDA
jgi:AcrR family transcriptional regulator